MATCLLVVAPDTPSTGSAIGIAPQQSGAHHLHIFNFGRIGAVGGGQDGYPLGVLAVGFFGCQDTTYCVFDFKSDNCLQGRVHQEPSQRPTMREEYLQVCMLDEFKSLGHCGSSKVGGKKGLGGVACRGLG